MDKENKNSWLSKFLAGLIPVAEGAEVNYKFDPSDSSIMKISWNSPNDGKNNLVNFLLDWEQPYDIKIKDNH